LKDNSDNIAGLYAQRTSYERAGQCKWSREPRKSSKCDEKSKGVEGSSTSIFRNIKVIDATCRT
jgi:hypothetical protein